MTFDLEGKNSPRSDSSPKIPDIRTPLSRWRNFLLVTFIGFFFVGAATAYLTGVSSYMVFSSLCIATVTWYFGWKWSLLTGFLLHSVSGIVVGLMPRPAEVETNAGPWLLLPIIVNELSIVFLISKIRKVAEGNIWLQNELVRSFIQREKSIDEVRLHAEHLKQVKDKFFAEMSHEIRTPIAAIRGFADILLDESASRFTDEDIEHLRIIKRNSEHLLSITQSFLQFSKLESKKESIEWSDVNLRDLVHEVAITFKAMAFAKRVKLETHVHPNVPATTSTDITKLRQILLNLVSNAIKFTENGSVKVHLECVEESDLCFSVQDSGIGIKPEQIDKIFTPFEQAEASISRRFGGTGLGLSICKQLATLLDGTLDVTSVIGIGSTFRLNIPIKTAHLLEDLASPTENQNKRST